ncbi:cobalamin-binding protein [Lysinibacillus sp. 2017]|uniref:ABC transporter substrate-binding protein n=1 Tax=unclassified Lysinibacillus TaxID=2636778 RepID=UPI000D527A18|nr:MULTISPECIES: ABC transporter substrate-binding protein [unclassified Lysinibacillus]AWE06838.1 cobalamin-binding protein [Lysinibacillus sp. 2017]TGN37231.1 ABC transporter substrate-binding protein [Lysinibacillus sp. S2017]
MKFKMKWATPLAVALLLAACGNDESTTSEASKEQETVQEAAAEGPYTVVDDRGVEVTFDEVPETIVSLQPSNTEILFELGVGEKIVGATDYDTYPEAAQKIERVSDSMAINAERIVELNPDVIVAYTIGDEAQIAQLEDAGLNVFVIASATSFDDVYTDIIQLSEVMGVEEKGEEVVATIQTQIKEVQDKTAKLETKKKVYYEISPAPDLWTTGSGTFQQEIMDVAGIENVFADQASWISVTEEDVITRNPEVILTTSNYLEDATAEILGRAGWDQIRAVQTKQVYLVDGDVMSRPAPRIGEAVQIMAETVYPELFK